MYTLQQDALSGDLYALRWDGDTITGYAGPLTANEAIAMRDVLAHVDYQAEPDMLSSLQQTTWSSPLTSDALQDRRGWQASGDI